MKNLEIYEKSRQCPQEALKAIQAGRLKGKSDINPMWRIKKLTELFGPCGIGWKYSIDRQWLEPGANGEVMAFCNISLFYKWEGQWSDAVPGTGGSAFIANERGGQYTSDECYKMALTDALSVSCKALGTAADVYWAADSSKYEPRRNPSPPIAEETKAASAAKRTLLISDADWEKIVIKAREKCMTAIALSQYYDMDTETIEQLQQAINKTN